MRQYREVQPVKAVEPVTKSDQIWTLDTVPYDVRDGESYYHRYCGPRTKCVSVIVGILFWPALCCCCFDACKCDKVLLTNKGGQPVYAKRGENGEMIRYRPGCCEF